MTHNRVQMLREKLDILNISDYHGLQSPGLTCYLNSVLQVLFMTEDFRASMKRCCSKDSTPIDSLLRKLFADLERGLAKTHNIVKKLGITDVYEQRDAAEYLEKILCLTSPEASKIFKAELSHKTTCVRCKKKNESRSFFWILPLAMERSCHQTYSVTSGLETFFQTQKVFSDNRMYCSQCDEKQEGDIDCEMTQSPDVLTLLLKRFTFEHKRRCYVKLRCRADAPQTLHVKSCRYELFALVHHLGNLTGGHYTAEIKSFETGEWYHFNDDIVERVKQPLFVSGHTSVMSCTAYLLMYRKVDQEFQCSLSDVEAGGGEAPVPHHQLRDQRQEGDGNLNGGKLKKSYNDSSEELDFQKAQKVGRRLKLNDISWDGTGACRAVTTPKTKHVTDRRPTRNRAETEATAADSAVNLFHVRYQHSKCRTNEPTDSGFSPGPCSNLKRSRKTRDVKKSEETVKQKPWR